MLVFIDKAQAWAGSWLAPRLVEVATLAGFVSSRLRIIEVANRPWNL
jgi:hypothetical protein